MELLQLKYFISAAESENFSVTAKKHLVPTSNISQTVKRLEAELGCNLFDRSANKIKLNDNGKAFYDKVKRALWLLEEAKRDASLNKNEISGEIRMSICTDRRLVTKAIQSFNEVYPRVSFIISHSLENSHTSDIVVSDKMDKDDGYTKKLLTREKILLASCEELKVKKCTDEQVCRVLKDKRFITMPASSSLYRHTLDICRSLGFEPNITITTDDPFYIRKYVEMGLGVAFVPSVSWQGQFASNVKLYSVSDTYRNTYVFKRNGIFSNPSADVFCEYLLEKAPVLPQKK